MDAISISMAVILIPLVLVAMMKTNAGLLFFAACAGIVLLSTLDSAVIATAGSVVPGVGESYVRFGIIMSALALTGVFFGDKVHGVAIVYHSIVAAMVGVMLWLLLPEATGVDWLIDGTSSQYWQDANQYATMIIAATFVISAFLVLPPGSHKKPRKRKKSSD